MTMRFMSPEGVNNMLRLIQDKVPPPPEITKLREEIKNRTNAAELKVSITGEIDQDEILQIVDLKLRLDTLYGKWCEGEL